MAGAANGPSDRRQIQPFEEGRYDNQTTDPIASAAAQPAGPNLVSSGPFNIQPHALYL
jgi:hypothetical protein